MIFNNGELCHYFQGGDSPRRCKVVATIGPSSSSVETLREMITAGLDVVRLNFSHGDQKTYVDLIKRIRAVAKENKRNITIMQDLQGPKIRCGKLMSDIELRNGQTYKLVFGDKQTSKEIIPIDYAGIYNDLQVGQKVLMDDGKIATRISKITNKMLEIEVIDEGILKSRKGVNFPNTNLSLSALTEKDSKDLVFGIAQGVDIVAISFVQSANDVLRVKKMITSLASDVPVITKIEKLSAILNINKIASVSDAMMVARGDLGVEARLEKVPTFQRKIIEAGATYGRPVVVATQMLESMINNPTASLSEVADIANAVLESADCIMLSAESASGKYPVQSLCKMIATIKEVESWVSKHKKSFRNSFRQRRIEEIHNWEVNEAIALTACEASESLNAKAIICLSLTGSIAASIAKWRPNAPIIAVSPRSEVITRLNLLWGVYGVLNPLFYKTDKLLQDLPLSLKEAGYVQQGDIVVITGGIPISLMCPTNMLKINKIP